MDTEPLTILESKIDELLAEYGALREERDRLRTEVDAEHGRAEEMTAELRRLREERAELKARVERILNRLNGLGLG